MNKDVENILLALAKGAEAFADATGNPIVGDAIGAASGLITGLASLLKHRTPDEIKVLITDLALHPAAKVDLSGLPAEMADIIRARRREEEDTPHD